MAPDMKYKVKKMFFDSFHTMVEVAFRIVDVLREQGILTKNGNKNNKDKGKNINWNKNKQVVNDGVVDSSKLKDQAVLHLASANQKVTSQDIKKGLKERNVTLHNSVSHIKRYS